MVIRNCNSYGNTRARHGCGIRGTGNLQLVGTSISQNVHGISSYDDALFNFALETTVTVVDSTISGQTYWVGSGTSARSAPMEARLSEQ